MFQKTQSLPCSNTLGKTLPQNLQTIQLVQKDFQNDMTCTLNEKRQVDQSKAKLINDGINELIRLVTTEQENLRSEIDPLNDDLSNQIENTRDTMENSLSELSNTFNLTIKEYEEQLCILENGVNQLIIDRELALNSMKSEFIISSDRLQKQINDERVEQVKIYQKLQQSIEDQLLKSQNTLDSEHERKVQSHTYAREDLIASAKLVQGSIMKKYGSVLDILNQIIRDNTQEKEDRILGETLAATTIQDIVKNMKNSLSQIGLLQE
ncbi:Beta-giardin [Spironucleus salmonicida]|uniref:Beta-giardin n=1 Tax=Spironucleus salmonicida TaxID=348837 RepID=V6LX42_9EUKA|nr:Beta-giardin [Spironucleus salmonicida]|eukprot:EST49182.1 Beta-giardin [Spironucleus salmonicida]